jgi:hypothetical protein
VLELKNKFPNLHYFLNKKKTSPNQRTKPESNPGRSQSKGHKHTMFKHRADDNSQSPATISQK